MALFDLGKDKKAAEEAKKKAEEAAINAKIAENRTNLAVNQAREATLRAEKAEKELKDSKEREAMIARQKAMQPRVTSVPGTGSPFGRVAGMVPPGMGIKPMAAPSVISEYTVKKGDTLSAIAKSFYGVTGPKYWNLIQAANKDLIKDVNVISPGQVFKIPVLPEELKKK